MWGDNIFTLYESLTTLLETDLDLLLPFKKTCITLVRYDKYLANYATNNVNVWIYTNHILYGLGISDLIVLRIVLQKN